MDELSPLFQEIEFHERFRGYDPDEVDAYVDRVARAAAVLQGRLTELHERVEAAEARSSSGGGHSEAEETLTRTLVLAQRTADAAIAEAREEAERLTADAATSAQALLSAAEAEAQLTLHESQSEAASMLKDAEDRAGRLLAEVETDRRTMVAEAEAAAAAAATAERERLAAEVSELQEYRAFLSDDIEILERHLTEERHQLTSSLSALTDLLESPEAFRARRAPETSGVEVDAGLLRSPTAEEEPAEEPMFAIAEVDLVAVEPFLAEPVSAEIETVEVLEEVMFSDAVTSHDETGEAEFVESHAIATEDIPQEDIEPEVSESATDADFAPVAADDEIIDLVAADTAFVAAPDNELVSDDIDVDRDAPAPAAAEVPAAPSPAEVPLPDEVAYAGMTGSSIADAPAIDVASPHLVTAADLESANPGSRIDFESSSAERFFEQGGPATAPMPMIHEGSLFAESDTADDSFLTQLRDVVEGEARPPEDDDALSAFFDQEDDEGGHSWFGRRR